MGLDTSMSSLQRYVTWFAVSTQPFLIENLPSDTYLFDQLLTFSYNWKK